MKKHILFLTLFLLSFTLKAQELVTGQVKEKIEDYISYIETKNQDIGSVSIFENGEEVYSREFGQKNLEGFSPQNIDLTYPIGSITKLFTAVMLYKLEEKGKINFEDPLSKYFPDMPNAKKIKLINMLNHSSGLKDYVVKDDSLFFWLKDPVEKQDIFNVIKNQGVHFQPNDSVKYSNSAYYLLARILEKEHKRSYAKILETELVQPLNLKQTTASEVGKLNLEVSKSYSKEGSHWTEMEEFHFMNVSGVGDIVSTPKELNIFLKALFNGSILSESSLEKMKPVSEKWFGAGIMKVPFYEQIAFGHGGDTYGTHSLTSYFQENNLGVTYIVNGQHYPTNDFAIGLLSAIFDKEFERPEFNEFNADPSTFSKYEGTYTAKDFPLPIKVFKDGNKLMGQGKGQDPFPLSPTALNKFEFIPAGVVIEFIPNENSCIFKQGDNEILLKKE